MLRQVLSSTVLKRTSHALRQQTTSAQKRALNKRQLAGTAAKSAAAAPSVGSGAPEPPSSGGGISAVPMLTALGVAAGGAAYYLDLIPGIGGEETKQEEEPSPAGKEAAEQKKEETSQETEKTAQEKEEPAQEKEKTADKKEDAPVAASGGNKVKDIELPKGTTRSTSPPAVVAHPRGGNKVLMKPPSTPEPSVDLALKELQTELSKETSDAIKEAHKELATISSLNMDQLDTLTMTQLKVRLVQMAKEIEDRTKWEAVRLKEFLALKEKETSDQYLQLIKKQRREFQDLMEQRLREQKNEMTSQNHAALVEKEEQLQKIVEHSLKIQETQFNDEKAGFDKRTEEAVNAKYEELFGKSLAQAKDGFAKKMEQKVTQMDSLVKKLSELELALQTSKKYQSGSVQAHRMSAAALALADRLESSKPAAAQVAALRAVADSNALVAAALQSLPKSVDKGVATLQELQAKFEESVHAKCRQAAMVPAGQQGLEGQLLGMVFSALKYPPGPDDPAPESEKDAIEYVLVRARRNVQMGELEQAVEQMDKLTGQAAFTAADWKSQAKERVSVDKALKVIRMECALANESMGKGTDE
jgi:mitofilin